jgi:hypothetical protein
MFPVLASFILVLVLGGSGGLRAETQQPPAVPDDATRYGIVCDGVTQTGAALQAALDTVPVGSRLVLPPGVCLVNTPLALTRTVTLQGAGINHTTLRQTAAAQPVLTLGANDVRLEALTVDHAGTAVAGGDGIVADNAGGLNHVYLDSVAAERNWRGFVLGCVAYGWGTHLQAASNNSNGFEFLYLASCPTAQWQVHHSLSQLNKGAGFAGLNTAAAVGIGPFLNDTGSFGNEFGGYVFIGAPGFGIYDLVLTNPFSSADNREGIYLDTYGGGHVLNNPWVELSGRADGVPQGSPSTPSVMSHAGHCVRLTSNNNPGLVIQGGYFWNCSWSGVATDAPYSSLLGGVTLGNGLALDAALSRRAGIHIGADGVTVSGPQFLYLNAPATLHYLHLAGALTALSIGHNTYAPGLTAVATLDSSEATLTGTTPPTMVAGLGVHSNSADAPGLVLYDASNGVNPLKVLRVNLGYLETLNAAASAVIHSLSDEGTPSWPTRRGQVTIADAATTGTVTLTPAEPDAGYFVQMTPVTLSGGPATGALTVGGVAKAAGSFVVTVTAAPGAGKSVVYDWFVHR